MTHSAYSRLSLLRGCALYLLVHLLLGQDAVIARAQNATSDVHASLRAQVTALWPQGKYQEAIALLETALEDRVCCHPRER